MRDNENDPGLMAKFEQVLSDLVAVPKKALDQALEEMKPLREPSEPDDEPSGE
jgi:hypothetical protein